MGVEVAGACFHWAQSLLPHHSSSSLQTVSSTISSTVSRRRINGFDRGLEQQMNLHRRLSPFLAPTSGNLWRTRSLEDGRKWGCRQSLRRAFSTSFDDDDDEEFLSRLQELAIDRESTLPESRSQDDAQSSSSGSIFKHEDRSVEWAAIRPEWPDLVPASVERIANSFDLPLSLRMIKRRKREEGFVLRESAYSSVKKAFSSMVFIIREIQSYTLQQMRDVLFYENREGILARVQGEMHASFVWLFEHIFSCTPTLMVYLMLLLANFTVSSMHATALSFPPDPTPHSVATIQEDETHSKKHQNFDPSSLKTFSLSGRTASVSGAGGGGGKPSPVAGATDDGRSNGSSSTIETKAAWGEEEARLWESIVKEAARMQAGWRDEALMDPEILRRFVSPVKAELESDDQTSYMQTEMKYQQALSQDPNNSLLLSNFAQFLFIVLHDHDRAEHYFKRAAGTKPADAESLTRYANFLWLVRNDVGAAEETYLEAIAAEPSNSFYASSYAHFLWNTGGEDTCYPLDGGDGY